MAKEQPRAHDEKWRPRLRRQLAKGPPTVVGHDHETRTEPQGPLETGEKTS